jgi:hypothetical protein
MATPCACTSCGDHAKYPFEIRKEFDHVQDEEEKTPHAATAATVTNAKKTLI